MAVTHDKDSERETHAKHDKAILVLGVIRVEKTDGILVKENRLGFLERDSVLPLILAALYLVPFKSNLTHLYTVRL